MQSEELTFQEVREKFISFKNFLDTLCLKELSYHAEQERGFLSPASVGGGSNEN